MSIKIKQTYRQFHTALRWAIIIGGALLIIFLVIQLLCSLFVDQYAASRLKKSISQSTNYNLQFDDLDIGLFTGSLTLNDIRLMPDSSTSSDTLYKQNNNLKIRIKSLDVEGVGLLSYFFKDVLTIDEIIINEPSVTVSTRETKKQETQKKESTFVTIDSTINAAISHRFKALEIDEFVIQKGNFTALSASDTVTSFRNFNLGLRDIRIDSASAKSGRAFFTDNLSLEVEDFNTILPDSLYKIAFYRLSISSNAQTVIIDSLTLIPRYPRFVFGRKSGYEIDRIDLSIPEIVIHEINFTRLANAGKLDAEKLTVNNAKMVDFRNKALPYPPNQSPPLPHIALRKIDTPIKIDTIKVNDAFISYNEYHEGAPQAGTVTFEHLNATIATVTNYPKLIEQGIIMTMDASAKVMGKALLNTHFKFPMKTEIGFHTIEGSLAAMPVTALNPMLKYVAFAKVDEGVINNLKFSMTLNNKVSNGTVIMNYENLKISLLDEETMKQTGLIADVKSLLANVVIVENNTPKDGMRTGTIQFERVQRKSFFNYWWKSLYSGMKDLILD